MIHSTLHIVLVQQHSTRRKEFKKQRGVNCKTKKLHGNIQPTIPT